jgi:glycosyltransferase involved in cell wall biosynthesis
MARWPGKICDYCCSGKAIVGTGVSDLPRVKKSYDLAYLAEDDTPEALASVIASAANDHKKTMRKGRNARKFAERELNWSKLARQLTNLYLKAMPTPE